MPYGQFVSSEPVGPGLYKFGLADGSSQVYGGAPAEDLNKKIQSSAPAAPSAPVVTPPQAPAAGGGLGGATLGALSSVPIVGPGLAAAAIGAGPVISGLTGGTDASKRAAATPPPPAAPAAASPDGPAQTQPASAVREQQPAEPGQSQAQGAPEGAFLGYSAKGQNGVEGPVVMHNGVPMVYAAPTKGSPGGFTKLGKGTLEQHQEARATAAEADMRAAQAQAAGVLAEAEGAAAQAGAAEEAKWRAAVQVNDQQEEIDATEKQVADLRARADRARQAAAAGTIDENQYMRGSRGALSGIAMALGAFGAVLGRSPNFAQEFVENQIQRNIRRQEAEWQSKRTTEANALGELARELGSLDLAKKTLAGMMRERTIADREAAALSTKSDQLKNYNLAVAEGLRARQVREDAAGEIAFREHVLGNKAYYRQGRAGSSGGFVPLTQESYNKAKESERADEKLKLDAQNPGGKAAPPIASERTEKIGSFAFALAAVDSVKRELEQRGVTGDTVDDPTRGAFDRATNVDSNERLTQGTVEVAKGLQSAFGTSDRDAADAQDLATGGGSGKARYEAAERAEKKLIGNLRSELATLPPDQQRAMLQTMPADVAKKVLNQQ